MWFLDNQRSFAQADLSFLRIHRRALNVMTQNGKKNLPLFK